MPWSCRLRSKNCTGEGRHKKCSCKLSQRTATLFIFKYPKKSGFSLFKRRFGFADVASVLISVKRCLEARSLLRTLVAEQHGKLKTLLLTARCYYEQDRHEKMNRVTVKTYKLLMTSGYGIYDVMLLFDGVVKNSDDCFDAFIISIIVWKWFEDNIKAGDIWRKYKKCVSDLLQKLRCEFNSHFIIMSGRYAIKFLNNTEAKQEDKILAKAEILLCVGIALITSRADNVCALKILTEALESVGRYFGCNAKKYKVTGLLLHQIGRTYPHAIDFEFAKISLTFAKKALKEAEDWEDEAELKIIISKIQLDLKSIRAVEKMARQPLPSSFSSEKEEFQYFMRSIEI